MLDVCYVMLRYAILCHSISCYAMLCYALLCYELFVMLCYALCAMHVMLWSLDFLPPKLLLLLYSITHFLYFCFATMFNYVMLCSVLIYYVMLYVIRAKNARRLENQTRESISNQKINFKPEDQFQTRKSILNQRIKVKCFLKSRVSGVC